MAELMEKIKIVHIITGLERAGAEMMLYKLLSTMSANNFSSVVISLTNKGPIAPLIEDLNIPVYNLGMRPGKFTPGKVFELARLIKRYEPDLVQTWMYHADVIGGIAALLAGKAIIAWNVRNGSTDRRLIKKTTLWTIKLASLLSRFVPRTIVTCSQEARDLHERLGYPSDKFTVIPNGFDLEQFAPSNSARLSVRKELSIDNSAIIIGMIARFHPQ